MLRRTLAVSILVGLIAGAIVAALVPQTRPAPSLADDPNLAVPGADDVAPAVMTVRRVAPPRPKPKGLAYVRLRAVGPMVIEARVDDPRGGPAWAVRSFLAERLAQTSPDGRPDLHVIGRNRCFQLGRIHAGRFGWLTTDGTFRPALVDVTGVPTQCVSRRPDLGNGAFAELRSMITEPNRPAAKILEGVVWGAAGAAGHPTLRVRGRPATLAVGPHGGMLAAVDRDTRRADVTVTLASDAGAQRQLLPTRPTRFPLGDPSGTPVLAAQAPDPDGGLPYALIVTKGANGICTMTGPRVVQGRAGSVDYALDTFTEDNSGGGGCGPPPGTRMPDGRTLPPWTLSSTMGGGAGVPEPGSDPATGRVARRTPPGRVILGGTAQPDVASLTIESPADVRTVVPAGKARGFIIVYGGTFATGNFIITTTFKNGKTRRDTVPASL